MLEAWHPVIPVSPNAIRTWREGEVISGAKSDVGDAVVIAEYLRLRHHRLHPVQPYSAGTKALRTVLRTSDAALTEAVLDAVLALVTALEALNTAGKGLDRCRHDGRPYDPHLHGGAQRTPDAARG